MIAMADAGSVLILCWSLTDSQHRLYLFTNLKAAQIQPLEDFAGHMPTLGLS